MIGYYSYAIPTLILIYLHPSDQVVFYRYALLDPLIQREFRHENPGSTLGETVSQAIGRTTDVVCKKLVESEKRQLCELVMPYMIATDHEEASFGSFLETDTGPPLPVPRLANARDPYTCKKIPVAIDGMKMEKPMYWCHSRRYKKHQSDEIAVAEGFFVASSRRYYHGAFMFRQSPTDDQKVVPQAIIEVVPLLTTAHFRSATSTVAPVSE